MTWTELSIEVPGEYAEPVSHLFSRHGEGAAVVETPGGFNPDEGESPPQNATVVVKTYLPDDPTASSRRTMIDVGLKLIAYLCPLPDLKVRTVLDEEWKNQRFEPVRIGRRLLVAPPGSESLANADDIVIPLEPGLAFGTGHHPTTAMVLTVLEELDLKGRTILDAGCGSGILSIAAAKLGADRVVAFDIDADAVRSTLQNSKRAGEASKIDAVNCRLPDDQVPARSFDYVLANISANVLIGLAAELLAVLREGGSIVASGVLEERYPAVAHAFSEAGGILFDKRSVEDWTCFRVRRV